MESIFATSSLLIVLIYFKLLNFKKLVNGSYIKFEYVDEVHKSMRLDILYKNVINEFLDVRLNDFDDVYDPGLLWLSSPYYVKKYGYDIIPK